MDKKKLDNIIQSHWGVLDALAAYDRGETDQEGNCKKHHTSRATCPCVKG